jgi:hypothetical protein
MSKQLTDEGKRRFFDLKVEAFQTVQEIVSESSGKKPKKAKGKKDKAEPVPTTAPPSVPSAPSKSSKLVEQKVFETCKIALLGQVAVTKPTKPEQSYV